MYVKFSACSGCKNNNKCPNKEGYEHLNEVIDKTVKETEGVSLQLSTTVYVKCNLYQAKYERGIWT